MANSYFKNADRDYFRAYIYISIYINNKFSIPLPETLVDSKRLILIEKY